jgi:hypothetical protein
VNDETIMEEHDRLQRRTDELLAETRGLSVAVRPFDRAEHAAHHAHLIEHRRELRAHIARQKSSPLSGGEGVS